MKTKFLIFEGTASGTPKKLSLKFHEIHTLERQVFLWVCSFSFGLLQSPSQIFHAPKSYSRWIKRAKSLNKKTVNRLQQPCSANDSTETKMKLHLILAEL
jgi:hypothetical protein